jgi:NAD-dependent dihydropyrimidine dehydrogenase PreA subunit
MPPVFSEKCNKCGICVDNCPGYVLIMMDDGPTVKYPDECWHCGGCRTNCPNDAVKIKLPLFMLV